MVMAANAGKIISFNQVKLMPATINKSCNRVATQDNKAAPALGTASARPARTSMPKLAMVAVLDTKPDASADRIRAF